MSKESRKHLGFLLDLTWTSLGAYFLNKDNIPIQNRDWYAGKIVEAVYIRDGKIVPFQYAEKVVPPADNSQTSNKISWIINEDDDE